MKIKFSYAELYEEISNLNRLKERESIHSNTLIINKSYLMKFCSSIASKFLLINRMFQP